MGMNQGYSQLFQGLSSSGGNSGNMNFFSDYASIKNGSYGKLLKNYYGTGMSSTGNSSTAKTSNVLERILEERRNPKVSEDVKEANFKPEEFCFIVAKRQNLYKHRKRTDCNRKGSFCNEILCVRV